MKQLLVLAAIGLAAVVAGCSHRDDPPLTPVMYDTTPTYRSTVRSTDAHVEPLYTQPGVNSGPQVSLPRIASEDRWDPNDPLATEVYNELSNQKDVEPKFLRVSAHDGAIWVQGVVSTASQARRAVAVTKAIRGVRSVRSDLRVSG